MSCQPPPTHLRYSGRTLGAGVGSVCSCPQFPPGKGTEHGCPPLPAPAAAPRKPPPVLFLCSPGGGGGEGGSGSCGCRGKVAGGDVAQVPAQRWQCSLCSGKGALAPMRDADPRPPLTSFHLQYLGRLTGSNMSLTYKRSLREQLPHLPGAQRQGGWKTESQVCKLQS